MGDLDPLKTLYMFYAKVPLKYFTLEVSGNLSEDEKYAFLQRKVKDIKNCLANANCSWAMECEPEIEIIDDESGAKLDLD
jgi:hypothetical protein